MFLFHVSFSFYFFHLSAAFFSPRMQPHYIYIKIPLLFPQKIIINWCFPYIYEILYIYKVGGFSLYFTRCRQVSLFKKKKKEKENQKNLFCFDEIFFLSHFPFFFFPLLHRKRKKKQLVICATLYGPATAIRIATFVFLSCSRSL